MEAIQLRTFRYFPFLVAGPLYPPIEGVGRTIQAISTAKVRLIGCNSIVLTHIAFEFIC